MTARETVAYWAARGVTASAEIRAAAEAEPKPAATAAPLGPNASFKEPIIEELYGLDSKGNRITPATLEASRYSQFEDEGAHFTPEGITIRDAYIAMMGASPIGRAKALGIDTDAVRKSSAAAGIAFEAALEGEIELAEMLAADKSPVKYR